MTVVNYRELCSNNTMPAPVRERKYRESEFLFIFNLGLEKCCAPASTQYFQESRQEDFTVRKSNHNFYLNNKVIMKNTLRKS